MQNIIELRHILHENAELSGKEVKTNAILNEFLEKLNPDVHIRNIGGNGIAVVFKGKEPGKRVLIRGDIDALNIPEGGRHCSHRCGHDGHASIIAGLAEKLSKNRPEKGEIVLLFQPAEETGQGAKAVIADPQFGQIKPDMAFALHNIPGYAKNTILLRKGCFAAGSLGLKLIFDGRETAHHDDDDARSVGRGDLRRGSCSCRDLAHPEVVRQREAATSHRRRGAAVCHGGRETGFRVR